MRAVAILAVAAALSGCSFGGKAPKQLLSLTPPRVEPTAGRNVNAARSITVLYPTAAAAITGQRVPVYAGPNAVAYVKDARWVDVPARQFQALLSETIAARTDRLVLDVRQTTVDPGLRLTGSLLAFGIDAATGQAVVTYDAILTQGVEPTRQRRFEARSPVGTIDALSSARALDLAAGQVASEVAAWVG